MFDVSGTAEQQAAIADAVRRCTFDYSLLLPKLQAIGRSTIGVSFGSLGQGIAGLASTAGTIQVSDSLGTMDAEAVFLIESGHIADFFYIDNTQRQAIYDAFHPAGPDNHSWFQPSSYWDEVGEGYTVAFCWAFSDLRPQNPGYTHSPSEAIAAKVRSILMPQLAPPIVPPKPPPVPPVIPPPPVGLTLTQVNQVIAATLNAESNWSMVFIRRRLIQDLTAAMTRAWPK